MNMSRKLVVLMGLVGLAGVSTGCATRVYGADVEYYEDDVEVAFVDAPELVYVEPGVYVVRDYAYPVYYIDGYYYSYRSGVWYGAAHYNEPWVHVHLGGIPSLIAHRDHRRYAHYHGHHGAHVYREASRPHRSRHASRPSRERREASPRSEDRSSETRSSRPSNHEENGKVVRTSREVEKTPRVQRDNDAPARAQAPSRDLTQGTPKVSGASKAKPASKAKATKGKTRKSTR